MAYNDGYRRHRLKPRKQHYFVRPVDGKRRGTFGRLKDAFTGEGPDVFITTTRDRSTLARDLPLRYHWTGWKMSDDEMLDRFEAKDLRLDDIYPVNEALWTMHERQYQPKYNFRTRRYEPDWQIQGQKAHQVWRDATWDEGVRRMDMYPKAYQDREGQWQTRYELQQGGAELSDDNESVIGDDDSSLPSDDWSVAPDYGSSDSDDRSLDSDEWSTATTAGRRNDRRW